MRRVGGEVENLVRVRLAIVKLLQRLRLRPQLPLGHVQRPRGDRAGNRHRRIGPVAVGDETPIRQFRAEVADVAEPRPADGPDRLRRRVHPVPGVEDELPRLVGVLPEKRRPLVPVPRFQPRQAQHGGGEVHEADEPVVRPARRAAARVVRREPDDQRHAGAAVINPALVPRQAVAVVGEEHHDGVFRQPVGLQLIQQIADLPVENGEVVVLAGEVLADGRHVRQERRDDDRRAVRHRGAGAFMNLALVGRGVIHDGEERRRRVRPVAPARAFAVAVPDGDGGLELIIRLGVVRAEIPARPQQFGEAADLGRGRRLPGGDREQFRVRHVGEGGGPLRRPHRPGPVAGRVPSGDEAVAVRGAHAVDPEGAGVPGPRRREPVEVRRAGEGVAVTPQPRGEVLAGDPENIGPRGGGGGEGGEEECGVHAGRIPATATRRRL